MLTRTILLALPLAFAPAIHAQPNEPAIHLTSIAPIPFDTTGPVLRANAEPQKPFTVAGERGVVLGQQDGAFEAWVLPVKVLSHFTIEAQMEDYPVPIDVNQHAAAIEVRPDRTTITYSHVGFTVRQIMFSPADANAGPARTGPVILYEFDCLHPTDFTFRFTPELKWMWPERNEGVPGVEWDARQGLYILHTDYPDLAAAITIPGAQPGILAPYQERPQVHPVELKLHIDPARDRGRLFPLLMAVGTDSASATNAALAATLTQLSAAIPTAYQAHDQNYKDLLAHTVSIETPDKSLNEAFQWAIISIEQLKTKVFQPSTTTNLGAPGPGSGDLGKRGSDSDPGETTLVAGYFASADSTRPGFGWFFGRDSLYTLYAVNGYGDYALTRSELEFLIRRQREDGKIMHEYSQTAPAIDWRAFPYMYAAADSTPLFLMAMADYARASGDTAFLTAHRDAIEKAWAFETDPAHDTDHDGIYDNSQGTGWVESWPGGMPHQEIYLALLDQQASSAYAYLEDQLHDSAKAGSARTRAGKIAATINTEYYDPQKGCYAFATNPPDTPNGPVDRTTTVYPALAWWDPAEERSAGAPADKAASARIGSILDHPDQCLRQFIASAINTDWGTRDVADTEKYYDGMSYHQGSVWPLFTGWAALAEYRANQPLAGYQLLKENANLTRGQDLGAVTELLSGDFFVPFGRSTSHQLWSSAMVITPTLRGLFGISIDATTKTIAVNPHLPATWDHAEIKHLPIGDETVDLNFARSKTAITVSFGSSEAGIKLATSESGAKTSSNGQLTIPDHAVQIDPLFQAPLPGNRAQSLRVIDEEYGERKLTLALEAPAGTGAIIPLIITAPNLQLHTSGASLAPRPDPQVPQAAPYIIVTFPPGTGWQTVTVTLTW
jgi:glycogen debranching enzyme